MWTSDSYICTSDRPSRTSDSPGRTTDSPAYTADHSLCTSVLPACTADSYGCTSDSYVCTSHSSLRTSHSYACTSGSSLRTSHSPRRTSVPSLCTDIRYEGTGNWYGGTDGRYAALGGPCSETGAVAHGEPFAAGCNHEPVVKADELQSRGPPLRGEKGGGKLEGIGSSKRMNPEKTPSRFQHRVRWLDAVPVPGECIQALEAFGGSLRGETILPLETGNG